MNKIIGIRYIGKKAAKVDTIFGTGAVWSQGQVHNFAASMATQLLKHSDSFEEAPVSVDGDTFMGGGKTTRKEAPVSVYANLTNMSVDQLALFAQRELNRTIDIKDRDIDAIRADVHRLMTTRNMDEIADEANAGKPLTDGVPYTIHVSVAELDALQAGLIVAKLVPAEVADEIPEANDPAEAGAGSPPDDAASEANEKTASNPAPTLDELLESLDKDGLLAFAIQEKVPGLTARNSVETMRNTIREALTSKPAAE
jgi:hypothetical protein